MPMVRITVQHFLRTRVTRLAVVGLIVTGAACTQPYVASVSNPNNPGGGLLLDGVEISFDDFFDSDTTVSLSEENSENGDFVVDAGGIDGADEYQWFFDGTLVEDEESVEYVSLDDHAETLFVHRSSDGFLELYPAGSTHTVTLIVTIASERYSGSLTLLVE